MGKVQTYSVWTLVLLSVLGAGGTVLVSKERLPDLVWPTTGREVSGCPAVGVGSLPVDHVSALSSLSPHPGKDASSVPSAAPVCPERPSLGGTVRPRLYLVGGEPDKGRRGGSVSGPNPDPEPNDSPYVRVPEKLEVDPGTLVLITVETNGKKVRFITPVGVSLLPQYEPGKVVPYAFMTVLSKQGTYTLHFYTALGDVPSAHATCSVKVGTGPAPDPPVPPGPTPPGPTPPGPTPPTPPGPTPVKGMHVLVVYESADLPKLKPAQLNVLFSKTVRDELDKLTPQEQGKDTHSWRMWDKDVDASAESQTWKDLFKRERKSVPWVIIAGEGKVAFEGPLPDDVQGMVELLKRYAPSQSPSSSSSYRRKAG